MAGEQAEGAAAKKVAGPAMIEVASLMGALEAILEVPAGSRTVKVRSLEVQHAAALAEMLHFQTSRRRWEVKEFRTLKRFASADAVLVILDNALLSILAQYLEPYGNRLHTLSVSIGGTFEEEVDFLHQDLIRHVNEARTKPLGAISELIASSGSIRAHISTLRDQVVGIGDHVLSEDNGDNSDDD